MSAPWAKMWTPISDDNLRGWVNTKEEAESVRTMFEVHHAVSFVGERRSGSTFGCALHAFQHEGIKRPMIRFSDISDSVVPCDDVPFHISSVYRLCCMYGRDKNKAGKKRHLETIGEPKRKRKPGIKLGCPAMIKMKEVIRFLDHKISPNTNHQKNRASEAIRDALCTQKPLRIERRIYIRLPSETDHQKLHELGQLPRKVHRKAKIKMPKVRVTLEMVEQAAERLRSHIHATPVMTCGILDKMTGERNLFLKCELLQKTGSFKIRGALNAVSKLMEDEPDSTDLKVMTHSSGNFGQALAYAARLKGLESYIVMPTTAPLCKFNAVLSYGGAVVRCEPTEQSRAEVGALVQKETGAHHFSPSQTLDVIAGNGTIGLELLEQVPDLDAVIVPVGGGGMIAGIATAIKAKNPAVKIFGAEPSNADDCFKSFHLGKLTPLPPGPVDTVADGLKVSIGESTWPIIANLVDGIITVSEDEIKEATRVVWQYTKQLIEPSAGVGVAAALSKRFADQPCKLKNVAVILCGGNVDIESVKQWI